MIAFDNAIKNKYDFVLFFDVENGNPNGDPDAGNMPRTDAETGHGIVTDVCIKRKVRNYVQLLKDDVEGYKIFVKEILNDKLEEAYLNCGINVEKKETKSKKDIKNKKESNDSSEEFEKYSTKVNNVKKAQLFMCQNYFDIRAFGAVMAVGDAPCGIVRGPIQMNFAKSIDRINPQEITVTRMAITNRKDASKEQTMGKKNFVPYALYKMEGYVSAKLAQDVTGFSEGDLELFWESLINMFEHDRSAARGKMCVRKLIVFKHESPLGNYPAHKLFERVDYKRKNEEEPARRFNDYVPYIDFENLPEGVTVDEKI